MANNGSPSLKAAVAENLLCSLSADRAVRGRGEQALTMLEAANEGELNVWFDFRIFEDPRSKIFLTSKI